MKQTLWLLVMFIGSLLISAGCAQEHVAQTQAQLDAAQAAVDEQRAVAEAQGDTKTLEKLEDFEKTIEQMRAALQGATNPQTGEIDATSGLTAAGAMLPFPYNLIVGLGGVIGVGAVQEWRKNKAAKEAEATAKSIVNAIDRARAADPELKSRMKANKAEMEEELTDSARRLIEAESLT